MAYYTQRAHLERHGQPWTIQDIKELIDLHENGVRWGLIAGVLGRTVPSCVDRLRAVRYYNRMPLDLWKQEIETFTAATLKLKGNK